MKQFSFIAALFLSLSAFSQLAPTRKLDRKLNRSDIQNQRPVLSGDGSFMIYLSDLDQGDEFNKMWQTKKAGGETWYDQELVELPVNNPKLNMEGAYFISYDGNSMLYTSKKSGGIGKYDIWETKRSGDKWRNPSNLGKPLNTTSNDGFPSLSPDGKTIYFSRCATMSTTNCTDCKVMMAERGKIFVKEPVALPSYINTGNSIAPLILADGKTLIYSSNKQGGKGGYDLFLTRFENEKWTKPIALDYINSSADEKFISIPAKGDIAYFSKEIEGYQTLVKARIPQKIQQRNILWLDGKIKAPDLSKVKVQMVNLTTGKKNTITPNKEGEFLLLATAGSKYDISVRDTEGKYTFVSRFDDLTKSTKTIKQKWNVELKMLAGSTMDLKGVDFKPYSTQLTKESKNELDRLVFVMKKNPLLKVNIGVHCKEVKIGEQKSKDLTEEVRKMITIQKEVEVIDSIMHDTTMVTSVMRDSLMVDSTWETQVMVAVKSIKVIDEQVEQITYHNNRTSKQAETILTYLKGKGIFSSAINVKGYGDKQRKFSEVEMRSIVLEVKF